MAPERLSVYPTGSASSTHETPCSRKMSYTSRGLSGMKEYLHTESYPSIKREQGLQDGGGLAARHERVNGTKRCCR